MAKIIETPPKYPAIMPFLAERAYRLKEPALDDLLNLINSPELSNGSKQEQMEVLQTIAEILFPELIGDIKIRKVQG